MRPIVLDNCVKCPDPCLKSSRKIPPVAVGGGIFDSFFCNNFRPEVDSDVIFGVSVDYVHVDVHVKFGEGRGADFVSNERLNERT